MNIIEPLLALARIRLSDEEKASYAGDLDAMLAMMEHIKQSDAGSIAPLYNPLDTTMTAVCDEAVEVTQSEQIQALSQATQERLYLVPKVLP